MCTFLRFQLKAVSDIKLILAVETRLNLYETSFHRVSENDSKVVTSTLKLSLIVQEYYIRALS